MADYEAIGAAIAGRFVGITPPTGERAVTNYADDLPDQVGQTPALLVWQPAEEYEWGPGSTATSIQTWPVRLLFTQEGGYARRMARLAKWRSLVKTRLIGNIQLSLAYVDWCYLRSSDVEEFTYAETVYDAIAMTVEVRVREQVTAAV